MTHHTLQTDSKIREYRIIKLLGEGGFGLTYLAFDTNLEKKVAIKEYMPSEHAIRKSNSQIIPKSNKSEKTYNWGLNAFLNEAKTLAKYEDPNIVRIYRFFKENGTAYIVMEYCEGGCLIDKIKKGRKLGEEKVKNIFSSIVRGLQLVHNDGILHRDIKPDNIMFRSDGTPVLIDFGAARQAIGKKSQKITTIITPGYAPLEQYSSKGTIGPWSDIYSLSAVAYMCLVGKKPPDIMNRLHEDTIVSLTEKFDSSPFIKSIDSGLRLHVEERPQNLSEWSSKWCKYNMSKSSNIESSNEHRPIIATRVYEEGSKKRPSSSFEKTTSQEKTVINSHLDKQLKKNKQKKNHNKGGFAKKTASVLTTLIAIIGLTILFFFSYDFYINYSKKENNSVINIVQSNNGNVTKNTALSIHEVQKTLNKLGYTVNENGLLDTRTIKSIKNYETSKSLVETGEIDDVLLTTLRTDIKQVEDDAWTVATTENTIQAYTDYKNSYPNGNYISKIQDRLKELDKLKLLDQQKIQKNDEIQSQRLNQITSLKAKLIKDIQNELKRLKFFNIMSNGKMTVQTSLAIKSFQKLKKLDTNGLPTSALLFQLKSTPLWPGKTSGQTFKDCENCPTMVAIPQGSYMMGSEKGKLNERPQHYVTMTEFNISMTEITFAQWDECFNDGACSHRPDDDQLGRTNQAVMHVNWFDTQQFIKWLNNKTKKKYRLPSEAEWEYAARANTKTKYFWGDQIGLNNTYCTGCNTNDEIISINQVKKYKANPFGLYDMHGNVWEWTQDCWHPNYSGAPSDSTPWEPDGCQNYVVRGGSGGNSPIDLRSASRGAMLETRRLNSLGFRVVQD